MQKKGKSTKKPQVLKLNPNPKPFDPGYFNKRLKEIRKRVYSRG